MVEYTDPGILNRRKGGLRCDKKRRAGSTYNEKRGETIRWKL